MNNWDWLDDIAMGEASRRQIKAKIEEMVVEARKDELTKLWNATQPSIVPRGWEPESPEAKEIQARLLNITINKDTGGDLDV